MTPPPIPEAIRHSRGVLPHPAGYVLVAAMAVCWSCQQLRGLFCVSKGGDWRCLFCE